MAQQRRNQNRQQSERKPPNYRVFAVIDKARDEPADWIPLGGAWDGSNGTISFTMQSEPLAWRNAAVPRRITLVPRDD